MNNQLIKNKVRQDAAKVKKDSSTLVGDVTARFGRFEDNVSQVTGKAKEDLTTWAEDNVSQMSKGVEKLADDAREAHG